MRFVAWLSFAVLLPAAVLAQECAPVQDRIDCYPDPGADESLCVARGCSWCPAELGQPWCVLPSGHGYLFEGAGVSPDHETYLLRRSDASISYFGNDFQNLDVEFEFQSDERLRITFRPRNITRFEVPIQINPPPAPATNRRYIVEHSTSDVYSFKVIRAGTGSVLLDTSLGGLTLSDQFLQLAFRLPSTDVYGIGENEQFNFRHSFEGFTTWPLYARDQPPDGTTNMYGVQPYFTVLEEDGNAFSVAIVNSNAQEFVTTPAPGMIYRTIGGVIDMYIFLGPTPENTVQQYTQAVGRYPIPPYWALGFQLSRWGYDNITNMQAAINRTRAANIPQDIQYGDIDIMDRRLDFTFDPVSFAGFDDYVKALKTDGIKFVPIIDPGIAFEGLDGQYKALDLGNELDVWIKRPDGTPVVGTVWPGLTYFADFSKNASYDWWVELLKDYKNVLDYESIWIDMNEIASWGQGDIIQGCTTNNINNPPYIGAVKNNLYDGTICPDAVQEYGIQYNTHSLYGWKWSEITFKAMREALGKRGFVVSRSTFLGSGAWATHWLGDNFSNWTNLRASIVGVLQYNQFGMPYVGADICGFNSASNAKLCQRWMELGAFYPFSRNHNAAGNPEQDPGLWPEVAEASRKALNVRYTLLPYLYSLLFAHRVEGSTVVRALWHEFPLDTTARGVSYQFLWGSGLLISPVVYEDDVTVSAYFPPAAKWYSYYDGVEQASGQHTLDAPLDFIPVHVRGGSVLPTQQPALNTMLSRQNPFGLIVALDASGTASGELIYDDGDSIDPELSGLFYHARYSLSNGVLNNTVLTNGYAEMQDKYIETIRLFGAGPVSSITVNGITHDAFATIGGAVEITQLNLPMTESFVVSFS